MKIVFEFQLSPRQKRVIRAAVVTGASIAALGIGVAIAAPIDTTWVRAGKPVAASSLKDNLDGLQSQATALQSATESVNFDYFLSANATPAAGAQIDFGGKVSDSHNAVTTGAGWKFTAPVSGFYHFDLVLETPSTGPANPSLYKNGSQVKYISTLGTVAAIVALGGGGVDNRLLLATTSTSGSRLEASSRMGRRVPIRRMFRDIGRAIDQSSRPSAFATLRSCNSKRRLRQPPREPQAPGCHTPLLPIDEEMTRS